MEVGGGWETAVTPELQAFLADLDMFYLGTANAAGQPYIQYRGGLKKAIQLEALNALQEIALLRILFVRDISVTYAVFRGPSSTVFV